MLFVADVFPPPETACTVQSLYSDLEFCGVNNSGEACEKAVGKLWARGDLSTQHILPRRRIVVFSTMGMMELVFNRPVDILRRLLESTLPRSAVEDFFSRFGAGEAAAMCLMLAAKIIDTENLITNVVAEKAAEAFDDPRFVGIPQLEGNNALPNSRTFSGGFSMGQVVQEAEPVFSGAYEGLCLCSARLLFPVWELPVMVSRGGSGPSDSTSRDGVIVCRLPVGAMQVLESKIRSLEKLLRSRKNQRRGLYGYVAGLGDVTGSILYGGPDVGVSDRNMVRNLFGTGYQGSDAADGVASNTRQRLPYTPAELAAYEVRAMECIRQLLLRSSEALFLLQLLCQHNVSRLVQLTKTCLLYFASILQRKILFSISAVMGKKKMQKLRDLLPGFGGYKFPLRVATTTRTLPDGRSSTYCGIQMSSTGIHEQPVRIDAAKTPDAFNSSKITIAYKKLDTPKDGCRSCGASMWWEERAKTATKAKKIFTLCCKEGKVSLPLLHPTPEPLKEMLFSATAPAETFRQKIRIYNSIFSFTSFGARIDDEINKTRGPYAFRISGQNYHRYGSLIPEDGAPPRFAQLYFHDTENEVQNRMGCMKLDSKDVDPKLVQQLIDMLDNSSALAKSFRMARDWAHTNNSQDVTLKLLGQRTSDKRQYNLPSVPEVAALIIGDFGHSTAPRDVVINSKSSGLKSISELHPSYMALQYPLLFPHGECGWHEKMPYASSQTARQTKRGFVTMREFYCYRLQQRLHEASTLIRGGRLFHQYIVDAFTAIEEQRLRWIKFNQNELRAELYNNICDVVSQGDTEAVTIGKRIILPATFTGGPRYMIQNYQDAMALCRAFGNPSLFITFTANPKWPEIDEMLAEMEGQTANDRPDLMARLFKLKLGQLMQDLKANQIFGPTRAAVYTIEFQKRGLPHAHILLWLNNASNVKSGNDIDEIISAEIPCKDNDPEAYKAVTQHMLHGPCGETNKKAPCMNNGICTKHFPKPFYKETTLDEDGFPVYRRRQNGVIVEKGKGKLDNRFVVPYNRYLLLKYDAHINVEWCNRSRAIKYLFKYINKGPDKATAVFMGNNNAEGKKDNKGRSLLDEIFHYLECRYLSACEAAWRIFGFDIHYSHPAVIRLHYHLPGEHSVTVGDNENLHTLLQRERVRNTMFTEWFSLNRTNVEARQYTYAEVPQHYVWNSQDRAWTVRKEQKPIGRMLYTHPAAGERYYLRMLLNVVKGPTSYEEIRTVNGTLHTTFREACYALGLLNEDTEWNDAIQEARTWATGDQLRKLFVTILLFCDVSSPSKLWEATWEALSEDILYRKRKQFKFPTLELSEHQIKTYCLLHIEELLGTNGKSLKDYPGMPLPDKSVLTSMDNRLIREELTYNTQKMEEEHAALFQSLNVEQLRIYHQVINTIAGKEEGFFFVYGAGGTGKTFLYQAIMARIRSERNIVLAVASSGIAALLLPGGRTAHSRFVIPLELQEHNTCGITQNTHLAQLMHEVKLIIWDEAPMTQRYAFEALNRTLQDIMGIKCDSNRQKLFGGIPVLLGGDFRQILPVITKGKRQEIVEASISNSPLWDHCQVFMLTQNMRVNERQLGGDIDRKKQEFNKWIKQVGEGTAPAIALEDEDEETWIKIPNQFAITPQDNPMQQLVDEVYPEFKHNQRNTSYLKERAILTPLNQDADQINAHMFDLIQGVVKLYKSSDEICMASTDGEEQQHMYPVEFLNTLDFPGMPPHALTLKEGLPVMLLRNVNPTQGLCNGTRLIITHLGDWVVEAEIMTGTCIGDKVVIPRITLSFQKTKWPFVMKRRQFPIKPCFAMTINKSQGQSLKHVGLYLPKPVFSHGQLYVAMSRVTDPKGLKILILPSNNQPTNYTKNVVYKEAFNGLPTATQGINVDDQLNELSHKA